MTKNRKTVFFLRHAESMFNKYGIPERDCGITNDGAKQASKVSGHYDLVVCSPMRRCRETLEKSNITYDKLIIDPNCRERKTSDCDFFVDEQKIRESSEDAHKRIDIFRETLGRLSEEYDKIMVVSHCVYINRFTYGNVWLDNCQIVENRIF